MDGWTDGWKEIKKQQRQQDGINEKKEGRNAIMEETKKEIW
jgi:hypothetical protein